MSQSVTDDVWVEVEVLKGTLVSVYRGRLARLTFEQWCGGTLKPGAITLADTYWSYDDGEGNEGWVVVGATPGPYAGAVGSTHLRSDLIVVMVPLRDGSEREMHRVRPLGAGTHNDD